jgi:hypothetical protein
VVRECWLSEAWPVVLSVRGAQMVSGRRDICDIPEIRRVCRCADEDDCDTAGGWCELVVWFG